MQAVISRRLLSKDMGANAWNSVIASTMSLVESNAWQCVAVQSSAHRSRPEGRERRDKGDQKRRGEGLLYGEAEGSERA